MPCKLKTGSIPTTSTSARTFLRPESLVSTPKKRYWDHRKGPYGLDGHHPAVQVLCLTPSFPLLGPLTATPVAPCWVSTRPALWPWVSKVIPVGTEGCEVALCRRGLLLSTGTILTSVTLSTTATVHFTGVETKAQHDGSSPV